MQRTPREKQQRCFWSVDVMDINFWLLAAFRPSEEITVRKNEGRLDCFNLPYY